jgi:hypothetical protein
MQNPTCGSPTYSTDGTQTVTCTTTIKCNLPVPIPFGGPSFVNFIARDTEPVVGVLPQ